MNTFMKLAEKQSEEFKQNKEVAKELLATGKLDQVQLEHLLEQSFLHGEAKAVFRMLGSNHA